MPRPYLGRLFSPSPTIITRIEGQSLTIEISWYIFLVRFQLTFSLTSDEGYVRDDYPRLH